MAERPYAECRVGERHLLVLDGRVVELFELHRGEEGRSWRWHVSNVGIDAGLRGAKVVMRIGGRDDKGELRRAARIVTFPAEQMEAVAAFIAAATAARDG